MITLIIVIYDLLRLIAVYHDSFYFYFSQKEKQMPAHLSCAGAETYYHRIV